MKHRSRRLLACAIVTMACVVCTSPLADLSRATTSRAHAQGGDVIVGDHETCFNPPCAFELYYTLNGQSRSPTEVFEDSGVLRAHNGNAWWAETNANRGTAPQQYGATWRPGISGEHLISAYVPEVVTQHPDTRCAKYEVHHVGGVSSVVVDQGRNTGSWVDLGRFQLSSLSFVKLDSETCDAAPPGPNTTTILYDAIRFRPQSGAPPPTATTPSSVAVDSYLVGIAEGDHVPEGSRVTYCFSASAPVHIRWWWYKPSAGWSLIAEWDDNGQGDCEQSDQLQGAGIRRIKIEALVGGSVVASDETYFYVDAPSEPPTEVPTSTPQPSATAAPSATPPASVSVWIESGCDRSYVVGQDVRVGLLSDVAGVARLRWQPRGQEFAVRAVQANVPISVDAMIEAPTGSQHVEARIEVSGRTVATATCAFTVESPATPTPNEPTPSATQAATTGLYLPLALRNLQLAPAAATPTVSPHPTEPARCFAPVLVAADRTLEVPAGSAFVVHSTFRNGGSCSWSTELNDTWWKWSSEDTYEYGGLPHEVEPGELVDLEFAIVAPAVPGVYEVWTGVNPHAVPRTAADVGDASSFPGSQPSEHSITEVVVTVASATPTPGREHIEAANVSRLDIEWAEPVPMSWAEAIDFSPDGTVLAVGGGKALGGSATVYASDSGEILCELSVEDTVHSLEVFDDGMVYMSTAGDHMFAWDWQSCTQVWHEIDIGKDVAVNEDHSRLVSSGRIWHISERGLAPSTVLGPRTAHPGGYSNGHIGLYGNGIYLFTDDGDLVFSRELPTEVGWHSIVSFYWPWWEEDPVADEGGQVASPVGGLVATSDTDGESYIWQVSDGFEVWKASDSGRTFGVALWQDVVVTAFERGEFTIRDGSGRLLRTLDAAGDVARAVQFSQDGYQLAVLHMGWEGREPRVLVYSVRSAGEADSWEE